jgi:hypothetical protein
MSPRNDGSIEPSLLADNLQIRGTSLDRNNEAAPLLVAGSSRSTRPFNPLNLAVDVDTQQTTNSQSLPHFHSSDEPHIFDFIMEKAKNTKLAYYVDKLAVESEPGLTNAQLMLNNRTYQSDG